MTNDPNRPVRLKLLANLLQAARARGLADSSIFEMGLGAVDISENAEVHRVLGHFRKPEEMYEYFITEAVRKFESNYNYEIDKLGSSSMVLRITPREERIEENGFATMTDRTVSLYRWGVAAGLIKAIGRTSAVATPIRLATKDSKSELIRFEWEKPAHAAILLSSRRRSTSPSSSAP